MATLATLLLRPHLSTGGHILTPDIAIERASVRTSEGTEPLPLNRIATAPPLALAARSYRSRPGFAVIAAGDRHFLSPACLFEVDDVADPGLARLAGQAVVPRRAIVLEETDGTIALSLSNRARCEIAADEPARRLADGWPLRKGSLVVLAGAETARVAPGEQAWTFTAGGDTWEFLLAVEEARGAL